MHFNPLIPFLALLSLSAAVPAADPEPNALAEPIPASDSPLATYLVARCWTSASSPSTYNSNKLFDWMKKLPGQCQNHAGPHLTLHGRFGWSRVYVGGNVALPCSIVGDAGKRVVETCKNEIGGKVRSEGSGTLEIPDGGVFFFEIRKGKVYVSKAGFGV